MNDNLSLTRGRLSFFNIKMKKFSKIVGALFLCLTFEMCNESLPDLSDVVILVSPPKDSTVVIESGHKVQYSLDISTINNNIRRFRISSFDESNGTKLYLDSACNNKNIYYIFEYTAPEADKDSLNVTLNFEAEDNLGNIGDIQRFLIIRSKNLQVSQLDGIVMYNPNDHLPSALSLGNVSQPFVFDASTDSVSADIYIESDAEFTTIAFKSNTNTKFIRNNSFNYATASARLIKSAYEGSKKENMINDIRVNDIILVGYGDTAKGVFMVNNIIRNDAYSNSCIQLSYKEIR